MDGGGPRTPENALMPANARGKMLDMDPLPCTSARLHATNCSSSPTRWSRKGGSGPGGDNKVGPFRGGHTAAICLLFSNLDL